MKSIFVFADTADYAMMIIGSIAAVCNAGLIIGFREFYAQLIDESSKPSANLLDRVAEICWQLSAVGAGMAVASLIQVFLWRRTLQRQMIQMRAQLFRSILRRPVSFFDQQTPAQLQNLLSAKTNAVALRLNDQPGALVYHVTVILAGYSWGFARIWGLTLMWVGALPGTAIVLYLMARLANMYVVKALAVQADAQTFVSEILHNIRIVQCFNRQAQTLEKYRAMMVRYLRLSGNSEHATLGSRGIGAFAIYTLYSLGLFLGLALRQEGYATAGAVIAGTVNFHNVMLSLVGANDCIKDLLMANSGMVEILKLMAESSIENNEPMKVNSDAKSNERITQVGSPLEPNSKVSPDAALPPPSPQGEEEERWGSILSRVARISFDGVVFQYSEPEEKPSDVEGETMQGERSPIRPPAGAGGVFYLDDCTAEVGQPLAFIGPSGSGKSTCASLLMKFYSPKEGRILLHLLPTASEATTDSVPRHQAGSTQSNDPFFLAGDDSLSPSPTRRPSAAAGQQDADGTVAPREMTSSAEETIDLNTVPDHLWYDYITYVPQEPQLFRKTIRENIRIALPSSSDGDVERVCTEVMLHDTIMALPQGYETVCSGTVGLSGGERQRLSLARMLLRDTPIIILDEPTSALDRATEEVINELLRKLLRQPNKIILLITHRTTLLPDVSAVYAVEKGLLRRVQADKVGLAAEMSFSGMSDGALSKSTLGSSSVSMSRRNSLSSVKIVTDSNGSTNGTSRKLIRRRSSTGQAEVPPSNGSTNPADRANRGTQFTNWDAFRVVVSNTAGHRWCIPFGILGSLLYGSHQPIYGYILARATNLLASRSVRLSPSEAREFNILAGCFVGIGIMAGVGYTLGSFWTRCGEAAACRMRVDAIAAVLRRSERYFVTKPLAVVNEMVATTSDEVKYILEVLPGRVLHAVCAVAIGLTLAFVESPKLAAVCLSMWPFMMIHGIWVEGVNNRRPNSLDLMSNAVVYESTLQIRIVKSLKLETDQSDSFEDYLVDDFEGMAFTVAWESALTAVARFTWFGTYAFVFWYGTKLITQGECSFLSMMVVLNMLFRSAMQCGEVLSNIPVIRKAFEGARGLMELATDSTDEDPYLDTEAVSVDIAAQGVHASTASKDHVSFNTVCTVAETEHEAQEDCKPDPAVGTTSVAKLEVKDLSYRNRGTDAFLLRQFNSTFVAGKVTTVLGRSGSGKSTLLLLLSGYFKKEFLGDITLKSKLNDREGNDLLFSVRQTTARDWRSNLSYVPQEPMLFSGTIRDNILYGAQVDTESPAEDRLERVLEASCLSDDLARFPDGLDTEVGYLGTKLSGGQRQRIAIARGLYRRSKILLLDEFTAALPKETKLKVAEKVYELARAEGRITVSVAHDEDVLSLGDLSLHLQRVM